ncbi:dipeptide/oligopeptide/nickel ABC transporter ATP-binding protein [bacterium SCGC AG-212-C10]|nr:dipeptide/oligopeptide/nickel ABC transporter ATP-binding protein [bacterium SCGC AG-212-C10]
MSTKSTSSNAPGPLLRVRDLRTHFRSRGAPPAKAVDGVSFDVNRGETIGLVGESGSGKSVTCLSIVRLVPEPSGKIVGGEILLDGKNLLDLNGAEMREVRGRQIAYITQDPLASLDPLFRIGQQVGEPMLAHNRATRGNVMKKVTEMLGRVRIPAPEIRAKQFPHEMSGGMRQRVVSALALGCEPELLIADEPTTALDVTVQAQILRLLRDIQEASGLSMILVTHDFGIVARACDRVAVMYAGRIVEISSVVDIFERPQHPYTRGLMASVPEIGIKLPRMLSIEGQPPDVRRIPPGCPFAPRCSLRKDVCTVEYPPVTKLGDGHEVACWAVGEGATPASKGAI